MEKKKTISLPFPFFFVKDKKDRNFVICSALGHLYGLMDLKGNRNVYPVFDFKWIPLSRINNETDLKIANVKIEKTIKMISILSKNAADFIHACDYDQEGEVIGYNILEYACNKKYKDSLRAKFSTLTDEEIRESFDNLLKPDKKLADAGISRHVIDFIYGINLSRALTQSVKSYNTSKYYHNITIGRVQGPTLAFVVDREHDIKNYISIPFWTIIATFKNDDNIIEAYYHPQRIDKLSSARMVIDLCIDQYGKILDINDKKIILKAPNPFNLGDLQKEAYRVFKFTPDYTLKIAEKLYLKALISYPRTDSQKLPTAINYKEIITRISKISTFSTFTNDKDDNRSDQPYFELATKLLSKGQLSPNEGNETDPAHPSIYPTGEHPKNRLESAEIKLFDLIIKRFLSTFGEPLLIQQIILTIVVKNDYIFKSEEKKIVDEGWTYFYKPYVIKVVQQTHDTISSLQKNDILKNVKMDLIEKTTQPPSRFNQATLLQKMEREKIGTKSTRGEIISTLFKRKYITNTNTTWFATSTNANLIDNSDFAVKHFTTSYESSNDDIKAKKNHGSGIVPTDTGCVIIDLMRKYTPDIVSSTLTRSMERQLEDIETGNAVYISSINHVMNKVQQTIKSLKENEQEIGSRIARSVLALPITSTFEETTVSITNKEQRSIVLGTCPICKTGEIIIKKSNKTKKRFAGCSRYSSDKCIANAFLPQEGIIKGASRNCDVCNWPIITSCTYIHRVKNQFQFCLNTRCPSKDNKKILRKK